MGFIHGNTNSFEFFFTDYGLQTFYREGLKEEALLFSASDDDANYHILESIQYDPVNIFNNPNNTISAIEYGSGPTVKAQHTFGTGPTSIKATFIPGTKHNVFIQTNKRGMSSDGKIYRQKFTHPGECEECCGYDYWTSTPPGLIIREDALKNLIAFEGDLTTEQDYSLLTYRKINGVKQFNIKGINGLYLNYPVANVTEENVIYDIDSFPQSSNDIEFNYTNSKFNQVGDLKYFSGSNNTKKLNETVAYSSITRFGYLILNELYDIDFELRFTFFTPEYATIPAQNQSIKVNIFAVLGRNKVPVDIYTPGGDPSVSAFTSNEALRAIDDTPFSLDDVEIVDNHKTLHVKRMLMTTGSTINSLEAVVHCRILRGMCKKNKDLTLLIDYNGAFGGNSTITINTSTSSGTGGIHTIDTGGGDNFTDGGSGGSFGGGGGGGFDNGFEDTDNNDPFTGPVGGGCLFGGTLIKLANGSFKDVKDIVVNDALASAQINELNRDNESTRYLGLWQEEQITVNPAVTYVKSFQALNIQGMYVFNKGFKTSPTHLHLIYDGSKYCIKTADQIKVGEFLIKSNLDKELIETIEKLDGIYKMYKIDTEIYDVFIANDYLTHNKVRLLDFN